MTDDLHALYATKVVELLEARRAADEAVLQADVLQTIARDLGMSDEDLAAAVEKAEERLARAEALRQHGQVDLAVQELEAAWALAPMRQDVRFALADGLFARWRRGRRREDLAAARAFARASLELAPTHQPTLSLLNAIDNEEKLAARGGVPWALVVGVALAVLAAVAVALLV